MYTELSRSRVQEPNRGQNYSEFYFTTYIEVEFENGEIKMFSFYEENEDEIKTVIEKWQSSQ
jgi:hypothetical protein